MARLTSALARRVGPGLAATLLALWQGRVMLWGFAPDRRLRETVAERAREFLFGQPSRDD